MNLQTYSREDLATIHKARELTMKFSHAAAGNYTNHIVLAASLDVAASALKQQSSHLTMEERIKYQERYLRTLCKAADLPFTFYKLGQ